MREFKIKKICAIRRILFLPLVLMVTICACHQAKPAEQNHVTGRKPDTKTAKTDTAATFAAYPKSVRACCVGNPSRFRALATKSQ